MNYLFMTQSHHDVTSLDIVMFFSFEINISPCADVTVLVILRRASKCSCLDWLFWMLHYLCKNHYITLHPFVWAYLITSKSWVLSTLPIHRFRVNLCTKLDSGLLAGLILRQVYQRMILVFRRPDRRSVTIVNIPLAWRAWPCIPIMHRCSGSPAPPYSINWLVPFRYWMHSSIKLNRFDSDFLLFLIYLHDSKSQLTQSMIHSL
jgi:hypothetical protein